MKSEFRDGVGKGGSEAGDSPHVFLPLCCAQLWWLHLPMWGGRTVLGSPRPEEGLISTVGSEALVVQGFPVLY